MENITTKSCDRFPLLLAMLEHRCGLPGSASKESEASSPARMPVRCSPSSAMLWSLASVRPRRMSPRSAAQGIHTMYMSPKS